MHIVLSSVNDRTIKKADFIKSLLFLLLNFLRSSATFLGCLQRKV
ncbi:hypothetical protein M23134_08370 [Microscilla marina ATCC 23134]|uniref:Uncharacterized protein n=1 Tax=Microscilla marina ATCC 23134 TaxID=313606 RepID=A1ZR07_MICM2|nr:hypothetical protein M23134_08370 [Microscilla marina ATCC 23134]